MSARVFIIIGVLLQAIVVFLCIRIGSIVGLVGAKWFALVAFAAFACAYSFVGAKKQTKIGVMTFGAIFSFAFVASYQSFGFAWFPGLVKDIEVFSFVHLYNSVLVFVIVGAFYSVTAGIWKSIVAKKSPAQGGAI